MEYAILNQYQDDITVAIEAFDWLLYQEVVQRYQSAYPESYHQLDSDSKSLFMWRIVQQKPTNQTQVDNQIAIVKYLIDNQALFYYSSVEVKRQTYFEPIEILLSATKGRHIRVVKMLLANGCAILTILLRGDLIKFNTESNRLDNNITSFIMLLSYCQDDLSWLFLRRNDRFRLGLDQLNNDYQLYYLDRPELNRAVVVNGLDLTVDKSSDAVVRTLRETQAVNLSKLLMELDLVDLDNSDDSQAVAKS